MLRTDTLAHLLEDALAAGCRRIGQVAIIPRGPNWMLCHADDAAGTGAADDMPESCKFPGARASCPHSEEAGGTPALPGAASSSPFGDAADGLELFSSAHDVARHDDEGKYRPLKSAPNLRHGWKIVLSGLPALRHALDSLYPAALGNWRAWLRRELAPVPLRSTLGRQTGMYRITATLTDGQAEGIERSLCAPGCLRLRLWHDAGNPSAEPDCSIPLLCGEACNIFIAAARTAVKEKASEAASEPRE